jgi:hypothetical protein
MGCQDRSDKTVSLDRLDTIGTCPFLIQQAQNLVALLAIAVFLEALGHLVDDRISSISVNRADASDESLFLVRSICLV